MVIPNSDLSAYLALAESGTPGIQLAHALREIVPPLVIEIRRLRMEVEDLREQLASGT